MIPQMFFPARLPDGASDVRLFFEPHEEQGYICRGDTGDARGLADGAGADAVEALASLGFHGGDSVVVDVGGDALVLLSPDALCGDAHAVDVSCVDDLDSDGFPQICWESAEKLRWEVAPVVFRASEPEVEVDAGFHFDLAGEFHAFVNSPQAFGGSFASLRGEQAEFGSERGKA